MGWVVLGNVPSMFFSFRSPHPILPHVSRNGNIVGTKID